MKTITPALLVLLVAAFGFHPFFRREPVYDGKRLGVWLDYLTSHDSSQQTKAKEAVRNLGTEAMPRITRLLLARDSAWKRKLLELADEWSLQPIGLVSAKEGQERALIACRLLGEIAAPAIPELIELLKGDYTGHAAQALAAIGPQAIPPLIVVLSDENEWARTGAAMALGSIRQCPNTGVPALIPNLTDEKGHVRIATAWALGRFGDAARVGVPALRQALNDPESIVAE